MQAFILADQKSNLYVCTCIYMYIYVCMHMRKYCPQHSSKRFWPNFVKFSQILSSVEPKRLVDVWGHTRLKWPQKHLFVHSLTPIGPYQFLSNLHKFLKVVPKWPFHSESMRSKVKVTVGSNDLGTHLCFSDCCPENYNYMPYCPYQSNMAITNLFFLALILPILRHPKLIIADIQIYISHHGCWMKGPAVYSPRFCVGSGEVCGAHHWRQRSSEGRLLPSTEACPQGPLQHAPHWWLHIIINI